jgi:hypothetical protein
LRKIINGSRRKTNAFEPSSVARRTAYATEQKAINRSKVVVLSGKDDDGDEEPRTDVGHDPECELHQIQIRRSPTGSNSYDRQGIDNGRIAIY